jgi:ubiquitin
MPQLKEALTAPQLERVQQIALQAARSHALTRPDVAKTLDLTKEQQEKIAGINQEFTQKQAQAGLRGGRRGGGQGADGPPPDFQAMMAKMEELTKERDSKATEVLSKEQQEKYEKLKGKPFDVAQLMQFGPGMGRGGRGGPGGAAGRPQKNAEKKE